MKKDKDLEFSRMVTDFKTKVDNFESLEKKKEMKKQRIKNEMQKWRHER